MEIGVCSFFRDSQEFCGTKINQIPKYFQYLNQQESECDGIKLKYYLLEGDSRDNSYEVLQQYSKQYPIHLTKLEIPNNTPVSSAGTDERRKVLSEVGNACLKPAVQEQDLVLWMESDLIPTKDMLYQLLERKSELNWDKTLAISPVAAIKIYNQECFYDGWAFEGINGEKWGLNDLQRFKNYNASLRPMKAIGSCALLNGKVLREENFDFSDGCFPKMCQIGREKGYRIYCDLLATIFHPSQFCLNNRWC